MRITGNVKVRCRWIVLYIVCTVRYEGTPHSARRHSKGQMKKGRRLLFLLEQERSTRKGKRRMNRRRTPTLSRFRGSDGYRTVSHRHGVPPLRPPSSPCLNRIPPTGEEVIPWIKEL